MTLLDKPDATAEVLKQPSGVDEMSMAAAAQVKARRPNVDFQGMGIPVGATLEAVSDPAVVATVIGPKKVRIGEDELSLSAATQQVLQIDYPVRPSPHWRYQDRLLTDIYDETYSSIE